MASILDTLCKALFGGCIGLAAVLLFLATTGCSVGLTGGGEFAIGMRNDNFLFLRSSVDGDKEGKTAGAVMVLDDRILDKVVGTTNCPPCETTNDDTDDSDNGDDDVADPISD